MDVRELRKKLKLSQQELADKTTIPRDRIAKWEQGKGAPKEQDLEILKKFIRNNHREDVPNSEVHESEIDYHTTGNYDSIVRTLGFLAEDKIRSTALMERLTVLLESHFNSNKKWINAPQNSDQVQAPASTERGRFGDNTMVVNKGHKQKSEQEGSD